MADNRENEVNSAEHQATVDEAYKEIQSEPVSPEDMKAADIIKQLKDNAALAAKVWCAYNAAKTREGIKTGADTLSKNVESLATTTVGKIKEGSKLYDEYTAQKDQLLAEYNKSAAKVAGVYDAQIQALIKEGTALKLENAERRAEQYALKKAKSSAKKGTKDTAKDMKSVMPQIEDARNRAMKAMQEGNIDEYQQAMAEATKLESDMGAKGLESTRAYARQNKAFDENKKEIMANKARMAEIKAEIKKLEDAKQEGLLEAANEKNRAVADFKEKTGLRNRITMFFSKFALNKSQKLKDNVFTPAKKWIQGAVEKVGNAGAAVTQKASEIVQDAKNSVRNKGLRAAERLNQYVQTKGAQMQQFEPNKSMEGVKTQDTKTQYDTSRNTGDVIIRNGPTLADAKKSGQEAPTYEDR